MGNCFLYGSGGGSDLSLRVVGGSAAPEAPRENMIWVETDAEIPGWVIAPGEPEGAVEGTVWISTGNVSTVEFNALRKNELRVCPIEAKQLVSGAWERKTARSYRDGAWVNWWNGELYTPGDEWTSVTGGWQAREWQLSYNYSPLAPTLTKEDTCMRATLATSSRSGVVEVVNDIDFTNYSTIHFEYDNVGRTSGFFKVAVVRRDATYYSDDAISIMTANNVSDRTVGSLDISNVSGTADLVFGLHLGASHSGKIVVNIYKVWLE